MRRVLVVDDERAMCELLEAGLGERGFDVTWRTSADEAFELALRDDFAAVVTDLRMRGMGGIALCTRLTENRPDVPVIAITAFGSLDTAIATIRAGAFDFLPKPFDIDQLVIALERATQQRALRAEVKRLQGMVASAQKFDEMVGTSAAMTAVFELIERVAGVDAPVLVTGESGTGKELVARALHQRSRRSKGPFVAVNCAALPESLLESELFGHVRGAFTDARTTKKGLFVEASGGTLFLDEIGEIPLTMQAKLLRALETRSVRPVGGSSEVPFDVNLVAATNRDLEAAVADGRFRDDLFYRLDVVHVHLPPLRSRGGDVLLLAPGVRRPVGRANGQERHGHVRRGRAGAHRLRLAGERARARQLHRARGRPGALRAARGRRPAGPGSQLPLRARRRRGRRPVGARSSGGSGAAVHFARPRRGRWEQIDRRSHPRPRSKDALPSLGELLRGRERQCQGMSRPPGSQFPRLVRNFGRAARAGKPHAHASACPPARSHEVPPP
jgi:DNA-binding NtrC family response regulator